MSERTETVEARCPDCGDELRPIGSGWVEDEHTDCRWVHAHHRLSIRGECQDVYADDDPRIRKGGSDA
jgi:uncharacterized protein with PIN domain